MRWDGPPADRDALLRIQELAEKAVNENQPDLLVRQTTHSPARRVDFRLSEPIRSRKAPLLWLEYSTRGVNVSRAAGTWSVCCSMST